MSTFSLLVGKWVAVGCITACVLWGEERHCLLLNCLGGKENVVIKNIDFKPMSNDSH